MPCLEFFLQHTDANEQLIITLWKPSGADVISIENVKHIAKQFIENFGADRLVMSCLKIEETQKIAALNECKMAILSSAFDQLNSEQGALTSKLIEKILLIPSIANFFAEKLNCKISESCFMQVLDSSNREMKVDLTVYKKLHESAGRPSITSSSLLCYGSINIPKLKCKFACIFSPKHLLILYI